jgi:corrinoid protein of di/trimethylamine methyltransferase
MDILDELKQSVVDGDAAKSQALVKQALDRGDAAEHILNDGLIVAMSTVGQLYEAGEIYVPEMLVAARAMKSGLELLRPALADANVQAVGKIVIGTVQGDLHDIGKNLVAIMMEGAGLQVFDLGVDVAPDKFVAAVKEHKPQLVGLSALLTTTMTKMKDIIDALAKAGVRNEVKVMIGGAPLTEDYARKIGADIFACDASSAATQAKAVVARA